MPLSKAALMCLETNSYIKMEMLCSTKKMNVKRKTRRRVTVSPFITEYGLLRQNPAKFFEEVKISLETFDYLLEHIRSDLEAIVTPFWVTTPEEKLCVTLGYLATGMYLETIAENLSIDTSSARKVIFMTMDAILKKLSQVHLREPTHVEMSSLAKEYYEKWKFPNCVGAIGGKYIRIVNPAGTTQKNIVSAVVDANFRFIGVYVIRRRDSKDSFIRQMFTITGVQCLPGTEVMLPLFVIGNEAFPLTSNLMKPYSMRSSGRTEDKELFNQNLKQARVTVDAAFEILTEKWKVFTKPFNICLEEVNIIVKVAALLHNVTKDRDGDSDPHFSKFGHVDNGAIYLQLVKHKSKRHNRSSAIAVSIRDQLCQYMWEKHLESLPPSTSSNPQTIPAVKQDLITIDDNTTEDEPMMT